MWGGDTDSFIITDDKLLTSEPFDYETKNSYNITVRSIDLKGNYYDEDFIIYVNDHNDPPSNATLSNSSIEEEKPINTEIGTFSCTDQDPSDTSCSYYLIQGEGDDGNESFFISPEGVLQASEVFNYNIQNTYSIRVRFADRYYLYNEKVFTISITKANAQPTDISLSSSSVSENSAAQTIIGNLYTSDPDTGDTFNYNLVGGDIGSFNINGNSLLTSSQFDYETKNNYSITVRSTDQGGKYVDKTFSILVINVKENTATSITDNTPDSSPYSSNYIVSVQVQPLSGGGTPTGTVIIADGFGANCTAFLNSGIGSCSLETSIVGEMTLTAVYQGDSNWNSSTATKTHTGSKVEPSVIINSTSITPRVGQPYTVNFTVSHNSGTPSGLVTISDGVGGSCNSILSSGSGSCELKTMSSGTRNLEASYEGDSIYLPTNSSTFNQEVLKAYTTIMITSEPSSPTKTGENYSIGASVSVNAPGSGTPEGTVSVSDGQGGSCTITLSGGTGNCNLATDSIGEKTITVRYNESDDYFSSNTATTHTVEIGNTTSTISDNPDPSAWEETINLSVIVSPVPPAAGNPSGTVTIREGSLELCSGTLIAGSFSCQISDLTTGIHTITASYAGDINAFIGSTSTTEDHMVELITLDDNKTSTSFSEVGNLSNSGGNIPYSYTLSQSGRICTTVNGSGNSGFTIIGSTLQRSVTTSAGTYSLCIQSVDEDYGVVQRVFSVIINNPPSLDSNSLDHATVNVEDTIVGVITPIDGQKPQVLTLANTGIVCDSANSLGNNSFSIDGNILKRKPDTLVGSYDICYQVEDAEGEIAQQSVTIFVSEKPDSLEISRKTISTNQSTVGTFTQDNGQAPFSYSLESDGEICNASNGADNGYFYINADKLNRQSGTLPGLYSICVQVEDDNHASTQETFEIVVTDPPSDILLPGTSVTTTQEIVSTISTVDGQVSFNYSLENNGSTCTNINGANNNLFYIESNALKRFSDTIDGTYNICIQTTDSNGEKFQKAFVVTVEEELETSVPLEPSITSSKLIDGDGPGTVIGTLETSMNDCSFNLLNTGGFPFSDIFMIDGYGQLLLTGNVNRSLIANYPLRIQVKAPDGNIEYLDIIVEVMENGEKFGAVANPDFSDVYNGKTAEVDVIANDILGSNANYWLAHEIMNKPLHGIASIGSIVYKAMKPGTDVIQYRSCDDQGSCVVGEVTFTVTNEPMPKTGFIPGMQSVLPEQPLSAQYHNYSDIILSIPKLGIKTPIVGVPSTADGWDVAWLGKKAGWLEGSAYPTHSGNSVITGHNIGSDGKPSVFAEIEKLVWGDEIEVHLEGLRYIYEVREVFPEVSPDNYEMLMSHKDFPWISLVTCKNYDDSSEEYLQRLIVRAVLIEISTLNDN